MMATDNAQQPGLLMATTTPGLEPVALQELAELTQEEGWVAHPGLIGLPGDESTICRLNLFARSLYRIYWVLAEAALSDLDALYDTVVAMRFGGVLTPDQALAVVVTRRGDHAFTSQDMARVTGQAILDSYRQERGVRPPVNLDAPDIVFRVEAREDRFWLGLDTTGARSLAERDYRLYAHRAGLKPPIAYGLVRLSQWQSPEVLLDPMCGSATTLLEAAAYARREPQDRAFAFQRFVWHDPAMCARAREGIEPHQAELYLQGYDISPKHLEGAQRNADAAGVALSLTEGDAGGLSLDADRIVVNVPYGVRMGSPKKIAKLYARFGDNLERAQWKRLVAITARPKLLTRHIPGELVQHLEVFHGGLYTQVLVFDAP